MKSKARNVVLGMVLGVVLVGLFLLTRSLCVTSWVRYGISSHMCPDGRPRQTLTGSASSLRRGTSGWVNVRANAHFTTDRADQAFQAPVTSRVQASAFLVHADGKEEPLPPSKKGWRSSGSQRSAEVTLRSDLKDGDYRLRFKVKTPLAEQSLDVPLPVYAPARIHVLTDRPLYEAGHTVRFRAVALRAKDLAPLDGRPGIWTVTDPTGEVLLEERSPAGAWGVASGSFPLDSGAETGDWKVRWVSGDAQGEASFTVKPFTLPRFRVEASASKAFYRPHEKPVVRGSVTYSSGAPVAGAEVALTWQVLGNWPAPYEWQNGALPTRAQVDKAGRFTFDLPQIPGDLRGQVTLAAALSATDPAGDRVEGSLSVLLAQEGIQVSTVTEIGDGLVQGFNNRLYLRVTDPGGVVLPKADLVVKRAWDPSDKGVAATTDEDGVASLQIDPGPAVNVVIPAMPYRPKPRPRPVSLQMAEDLLTGEEPGLADRKVLDGWLDAIAPCGRFVEGSGSDVTLGVRADAAGAILAVGTDALPLSRCVAQVLKEKRLAAGPERLLHLRFGLLPPALPEISTTFSSVPDEPEGLEQAVREAVLDSRPCLPKNLNEDLDFDRFATWKTTKGSKQVAFSWAREGKGEGARLRTDACVDAKFRELTLAEPAEQSGVGIIRFRAVPYYQPGETRPQATTMLGYEFLVTAKVAGEEVGSARLRVNPGVVPPIRLRMSPVLVKAGEKLKLEILRGPQFQGELPEKLYFQNEGHSYEVKTETDRRSATFTVPAKAQGWFQVSWGGAQTMAFVRPETTLSVSVRAEREHYAPGQTAKLLLETRAGEKGTAAAVTLSGVDESLSQLVPLPGGDELAKLRTHATMTSSAFGSLDAQALAMGRVRGANAAAAVVLRVASPPPAQEIDNYVNASSSTLFTPLEDLTDHFYTVLGELYTQTRRWEETAPAAEKMKPKTMAQLWNKALDACEKRGEAVGDAYGRRLRLSWLPNDLLGLVEPRVVVVQAATRLPEDVENWQAWVAKEKP